MTQLKKAIRKVSEENLNTAEKILLRLSESITKIDTSKNRKVNQKLEYIKDVLRKTNADVRIQTQKDIEADIQQKEQLVVTIASLEKSLKEQKDALLEDEVKSVLTVDDLRQWKTDNVDRLDNQLLALKEKNNELKANLKAKTRENKAETAELNELTTEINDLIKINERMKVKDLTSVILNEQKNLEKERIKFLQKIVNLTKTKTKDVNVDNEIGKVESDLKRIEGKISALGVSLPNEHQQDEKHPPPKNQKAVIPELKEIESIITQVRKTIKSKRILLAALKKIKKDLEKCNNCLEICTTRLEGEKERKRKETLRQKWIQDKKTYRKNLEESVHSVRTEIKQLNESISRTNVQYQSIYNIKETILKDVTSILDKDIKLNKAQDTILTIEEREKNRILPHDLWFLNVKSRIETARQTISLGKMSKIFLFPHQAFIRYQTGKYIRLDLIKAEREFQNLGILSQEYLEKVEIFNRKDSQGKQLSLDILRFQ